MCLMLALSPGIPCKLQACFNSTMLSKLSEWGNTSWVACCCRCDYVDFDVAVFTNIAKDKVDAFGGIQQYLDAQGSLFLKLQDHVRQRAVINSDGVPPLLAIACRHMYLQDIGISACVREVSLTDLYHVVRNTPSQALSHQNKIHTCVAMCCQFVELHAMSASLFSIMSCRAVSHQAEHHCSLPGLKLCCGADPYADDFRRFASKVPVVTYAINDRTADVYAEKVSLGIWESEVIIATPIGHINILTPLIGRNNVYNVLAAVATGLSINVPLQASHARLILYLVTP